MSFDQVLIALMAVFALLGGLDRILGGRFGLGQRFEEGILAMGSLALAMVGILLPLGAAYVERGAKVLIAEADGVPAGIALWFNNFSTWLARPGIYLEDLYVRAPYRHRGLGKALLRRLAQLAVENDWGRVEWSCLKWNTPSLDFYCALGAQTMDEWTALRLDGQHLQDFGQPTPATPK